MDSVFPIENSLRDSKPFFSVMEVALIGLKHTICDQKPYENCIRVLMTSSGYWKMLILMACSAMNTFSDIFSANADLKLMAGFSRPTSCPSDNSNKSNEYIETDDT